MLFQLNINTSLSDPVVDEGLASLGNTNLLAVHGVDGHNATSTTACRPSFTETLKFK